MNPFIQTMKNDRQTTLIVEKLRPLISALQNANKAFKRIAGRCTNRKAQMLVFGLATESFQFYRELSLYVQVLKGKSDFNENIFTDYQYDEDDREDVSPVDNFDRILEECTQIEKNLITEFRKLLNDSLVIGDIRKMLQEQLNGFLYAFVKIKMLSNLNVKAASYMDYF